MPARLAGMERRARSLRIGMIVVAVLFMALPAINLVNINLSRILDRASEIGVAQGVRGDLPRARRAVRRGERRADADRRRRGRRPFVRRAGRDQRERAHPLCPT